MGSYYAKSNNTSEEDILLPYNPMFFKDKNTPGTVYVVVHGLPKTTLPSPVQDLADKTGHASIYLDLFGHSDEEAIHGLRIHLTWDATTLCAYEVVYKGVMVSAMGHCFNYYLEIQRHWP
jgi:hypothetical protein